ncbi:MAG: hypothetical protein ACI906_001121 [Candidatus Latescibacterota bacterium]|jgi:hypothetical protein
MAHLLFITSDQGDHGMAFKDFFYDSMARVPLMVRDERYKYAYYASGDAELYDMQEDSDEVEEEEYARQR